MADESTATFLTLKQVNGDSHKIEIDVATATVLDLKLKVQAKLNYPPEAQRLIFQGRVLDDKNTLASYSLASGLAVHLAVNSKLVPTPAAATSTPPPVASSGPTLAQLLPLLRASPSGPSAIATLTKMAENIINNPGEEKYRKIRLANEALKRKVLDVPHGMACVRAMGFAPGVEDGHLVLVPNASNWEHLLASKRTLDQFNATAAAPAFPFPSAAPAPSSGFPTGGGMSPGMLSSMLQNPMFMQMMQSDPRIQQMAAGNPMLQQALQSPAMLQQSLQMMQNNPYMRQQLEQLMSNPQQMQQMMQGDPMLGNPFGGFGSAAPPSTAPSPFATPMSLNQASSSVPTPQQPTLRQPSAPAAAQPPRSEEDEIAEAIARSLREM
ncbi:hypothetical protein AC1031_017521 [Aphanomyces cochlioides]|nr:hypothetical protein AC1031_017521 [Aphanomyces cochlioides]